MDKKVLVIVHARGGSKGVPQKNIKELNGNHLITYTIEAAKKSININRILVSTEDEQLVRISKKVEPKFLILDLITIIRTQKG